MTIKAEPFAEFAACYDSFMLKCVNYDEWIKYLENIFKHFQYKPKTILDLACGTGIPTLRLAKRGYRMIGLDRSPAMLGELRKKKHNYNIDLYEADMRNFNLPEKADAAISLYDSINYLLTEEDLARCFNCVRAALVKNGLFIFDLNTTYGLSIFWGNRETIREAGNIRSIWQNRYDNIRKISTLHLTCLVKNENRTFEEIHQERGYELSIIENILKDCGFADVTFYHHGTFSPPGAMTIRVMVVAR